MDKRIVFLLGLTVIVSGCLDDPDISFTDNDNGDQIVVSEFDISDDRINTGQEVNVRLLLENHYHESVEFEDIDLYSTGILELEKEEMEERCSSDTLESVNQDIPDRIECNWVLKAPEEMDFESRQVSINLNMNYSSTVSNNPEPFKIVFKDASEIHQTERARDLFGNRDLEVEVGSDSPAQASGDILEISVEPVGSGSVVDGYELDYSPESVVECGQEIEMLFDNTAELSCDIQEEADSQVTREIGLSISYKYLRTESLNVEVVNR